MTTAARPHEGAPAVEPSPTGLRQRLGLFDSTMLVAGSMIGSGIFIVSADIVRDVGSSGWLLFIWALTGVMTVAGALSYAELAAMMPNAGGQYVYLREAHGPLWGFLYGWTAFLVIQTGFIAAVSVAFAKFLGVLVPALGTGTNNILWSVPDLNINLQVPVPWMKEPLTFFERKEFTVTAGQLVAVAVIVLLTYINCRGLETGKLVQNVFTVAKTLGLLLLIVLGLTVAANPAVVEQNLADPWGGITTTEQYAKVSEFMPLPAVAAVMVLCGAMIGALFSSDAWNNVTFTAGEVKNPRRNLPLSLALGTGLVILLYLLANVAYLGALPARGDKETALQLAAEAKRAEAGAAEAEYRVRKAEADAAAAEAEAFARTRQAARLRAEGQAQGAQEMEAFSRRGEAEVKESAQEADFWRQKAAEARRRGREIESQAAFARGIDHARDDRVGTAVLERASPNFGVPLMAVAIMVSTFGCVNGLVLSGARLYYAMARDGLFFRSVGRLNRNHVPAFGLVLQGAWAVVLVFSGSYNELLDYIIWAALFFYVLTVTGLFVLRRKMPDAERPYRAVGYPVVPGLYVLLCAVIMLALLFVRPVYSWPSFLIVLTGIPVYFLWRRGARAELPSEPEV
jgi:amino acid transporter